MYPITLSVKKRHCLVVGGGGIAVRKLDGLLAGGALVTVVAEEPAPAIAKLAEDGTITLKQRRYRDGEATDFWLVIAATDDREVNKRVFADADGAGVLVNVVDDPPLCTFHLPARVQRELQNSDDDSEIDSATFQWALQWLPTVCAVTVKGGGILSSTVVAGMPGLALAIIEATVGDVYSDWLIKTCCQKGSEALGAAGQADCG